MSLSCCNVIFFMTCWQQEECKLYHIQHEDQIRQDHELHKRLMAGRAMNHYQKHYEMCSDIVVDIVNFTTKIAEYRQITNRS